MQRTESWEEGFNTEIDTEAGFIEAEFKTK
jgi:hypothetical protein